MSYKIGGATSCKHGYLMPGMITVQGPPEYQCVFCEIGRLREALKAAHHELAMWKQAAVDNAEMAAPPAFEMSVSELEEFIKSDKDGNDQ